MVPLDKEREGKSVLRGWRLAGSEPYTWLVFWADVRSGVAMLAIGVAGSAWRLESHPAWARWPVSTASS